MRPGHAAYRTPIGWRRSLGNTGDGDTYTDPQTIYGQPVGARRVTAGPQGSTVTDPHRVNFPHRLNVAVGDVLVIDGEEAVVQASTIVRGAFGVPHHRHVEAV